MTSAQHNRGRRKVATGVEQQGVHFYTVIFKKY